MGGAIDKLEIDAPGSGFWTRELRKAYEHAEPASDALLRMQGNHYRNAIDLRYQGIPAILFANGGPNATNKLVLLRVGEMSLPDIASQISALFNANIWNLAVKRIDIAVDVLGYDVKWFKIHTGVKKKRGGSEFVNLRRDVAGRVESLYFGARPNLIRIYDKLAERGLSDELEPVTRAERQYGGGKIPSELATLANLSDKALEINPFAPLMFSAVGDACDVPAEVNGSDYLKVVGLRHAVNTLGYQTTRLDLNRRTGGKAKRLMERVEELAQTKVHFDPPNLYALYRESLRNQLGSAMHFDSSVGIEQQVSPVVACAESIEIMPPTGVLKTV